MASLVGRFTRTLFICIALIALVAPLRSMAAPFAAIIMDAKTGEELWSDNADARLHPASLTKMMTLYITFQEIQAGRMSLDTLVTVSKHASAQPPSRLGLKQGQKIKVRYLIRAAAIKSANDAAAALGDHIGGSEAGFAERMTRTARALGMRNSTFKNAHGLTASGHLSTARDMTLLGRHLFYDFPQFYNIFSRRTADAGLAKVNNTNTRFLDGYEGADGIKTGYTVAAGFNLTASAKRGDKRIIATVFGGTSTAQRNAKMVELMNKGFGLAKNGARERRPDAAPIPEKSAPIPREDIEALVAEAARTAAPAVPGASAKTLRISGEVLTSPRPRARPGRETAPDVVMVAEAAAVTEAAVVPDALAAAIAEGVESALAEAVAEPPPPGTFEAQAIALDTPAIAEEEAAVVALAEVRPAPAPGSLEAQAASLADAGAAPPVPGSLEAQAEALAQGTARAEAPIDAMDPALLALAGLRPQPRPATVAPAQAEVAAEETLTASAETVMEMVAPAEDAPQEMAAVTPVAAPAPAAAAPSAPAVEMVAEAAVEAPVETLAAVEPQPEPAAGGRKAPIFDSVELASAAEPAEELVVVSKSTSGGRAWGVSVGAYTSHYEAERALLKTGLAESATLDQSLRKVTQSGGKYRASFLGLSEDEAGLACRRLRARGMACEATGPA